VDSAAHCTPCTPDAPPARCPIHNTLQALEETRAQCARLLADLEAQKLQLRRDQGAVVVTRCTQAIFATVTRTALQQQAADEAQVREGWLESWLEIGWVGGAQGL